MCVWSQSPMWMICCFFLFTSTRPGILGRSSGAHRWTSRYRRQVLRVLKAAHRSNENDAIYSVMHTGMCQKENGSSLPHGFVDLCGPIEDYNVDTGLINPLPPLLHQKVQKIFNRFWSDQSPPNKETSRPEDNWTTIPYYSTRKLLWLANSKMGMSNWGEFVAYTIN